MRAPHHEAHSVSCVNDIRFTFTAKLCFDKNKLSGAYSNVSILGGFEYCIVTFSDRVYH